MTTEATTGDGRAERWKDHRPALLAAATEYVLDHGVATLTLRPLGDAIGSSITSLNRQFGSKDQLVQAVCVELHERMLTDVAAAQAGAATQADVLRSLWRLWLDPAKAREFAFLFELYGLAVREPDRYEWFTTSVVEDWLAPFDAALVDLGHDPAEARALTTLGLALIRGLHLDLASTGDVARVDAAFELALGLIAPHLQRETP